MEAPNTTTKPRPRFSALPPVSRASILSFLSPRSQANLTRATNNERANLTRATNNEKGTTPASAPPTVAGRVEGK